MNKDVITMNDKIGEQYWTVIAETDCKVLFDNTAKKYIICGRATRRALNDLCDKLYDEEDFDDFMSSLYIEMENVKEVTAMFRLPCCMEELTLKISELSNTFEEICQKASYIILDYCDKEVRSDDQINERIKIAEEEIIDAIIPVERKVINIIAQVAMITAASIGWVSVIRKIINSLKAIKSNK